MSEGASSSIASAPPEVLGRAGGQTQEARAVHAGASPSAAGVPGEGSGSAVEQIRGRARAPAPPVPLACQQRKGGTQERVPAQGQRCGGRRGQGAYQVVQ